MSPVLRSPLAGAALLALAACSDPAEPRLPLDGDAVLQNGALLVHGTEGANDIRVTYSSTGVRVERDGESVDFAEPVASVEIRAGQGDDVVRYAQTVVAGLGLTIGAGDGDDEVFVRFDPSGAGDEMTLPIVIDTGPGGDLLDFRWDGAAVPALNPHITLEGETASHTPEVDDEVLVSFESGDPDRPVVLGGLWNGSGPPSGAPPGGDRRSLLLELDFRAGFADVAVAITGGAGPDSLVLDADYSGVTLQQGRVSLDADLNEGKNHVGKYILTSATHTYVGTEVRAGDGNNVVDLESVIGGDTEQTYVVELGDGDNRTSIRFGDGVRGRRPSTGQRTVTTTYRSGAGQNDLEVDADVIEPITSDLAIDFGDGAGSAIGRYKLKFPWDLEPTPSTQVVPSQVEVVLLAPQESALDLRIEVGDPDAGDPEAFGVVEATGAAVQQTDWAFIHERATSTAGAAGEEQWTLHVKGLSTTADASIAVDAAPGLERLVYVQESMEVGAGATSKVALRGHAGADAMLAHLLGIGGAGRFELVTDGAAGNDVLAVLTRALDAAGGAEMAFDLLGGDGDDVLGLEAPAGLPRDGPIRPAIAAGLGDDACFAWQDVPATDCERREDIGEELIGLLETLFGAELADVWRQPGS